MTFLLGHLINISHVICQKLNFNPSFPTKKKEEILLQHLVFMYPSQQMSPPCNSVAQARNLVIILFFHFSPKPHPSPSLGHFDSKIYLKTHPCLSAFSATTSSLDDYNGLLLLLPHYSHGYKTARMIFKI